MTVVHVNGAAEPALGDLLRRAVETVLEGERIDSEAEISVTLLPDRQIRDLNLRWLERDRPTDVLAFALHEDGSSPLGDVYLGLEQARRQAREAGVDEEEELVRLAVHGTLHVLGWDHPKEGREESPMFQRQEELVARVMEAG